jgi:hypothetical protein
MRDRIRRLSWKVELAIVLCLAFGWTVPSTLHALFDPSSIAHRATPPVTDTALWGTIIFELVILSLLALFLRLRGWTLSRLGLHPTLGGCLQGLGLALAAYGLYVLFAMTISSVWPQIADTLVATKLVGDDISWITVGIASLLNPIYEEVFVCGYVISVLTAVSTDETPAGAAAAEAAADMEHVRVEGSQAITPIAPPIATIATAINLSAGIRLSYHLYQGVAGVLAIVPLGLLFATWFARTRQLWPLIVAHMILDFVPLAAAAGGSS